MALNIDGTTGISGVDGSASAPALQGTDSNTGINFGSDTVNINTGGQTRATVDSSGNLGIGETSPAAGLDVKVDTNPVLAIDRGSANTANFNLQYNGTTSGQLSGGNQTFEVSAVGSSTPMNFFTNGSERMRIASDGKVNIGGSSGLGSKFVVRDTGFDVFGVYCNSESHGTIATIKGGISGTPQSTLTFISFQRNDGGTRGSITANTNVGVAYNTTSDYRLKENIVAISDGITRLKTLKPSRFNWIGDTSSTRDGFIAHEVTAVPEAITGTKDEVYTEDEIDKNIKAGDPKYQGIDQAKLVPLITAALQEAVSKIEVLETKVAALEAA